MAPYTGDMKVFGKKSAGGYPKLNLTVKYRTQGTTASYESYIQRSINSGSWFVRPIGVRKVFGLNGTDSSKNYLENRSAETSVGSETGNHDDDV